MTNIEFTNSSKENLDFSESVKPYLKNWKWFIIVGFLALLLGYFYNRYAVPEYAIQAKIQVLEDENSSSNFDIFRDLQTLGAEDGEIEDEIAILTARSNLNDLVKELGLNVTITALGYIRDTDIYRNPNPPFKINFLAQDSLIFNANANFFITLSSKTSFEFSEGEDGPKSVHSYGNPISSSVGEVIITPNDLNVSTHGTNKFKVTLRPLSDLANYYYNRLDIFVEGSRSKIITILLNDPLIERAQDVINTLIANYNQNAIDDKKAIADRTSNFINERIARIASNLSTTDQTAVEFKSGRGLSDITTQNTLNLNLGAANQQQLQDAAIQLDISTSMLDLINNERGYELIPANIGLQDPSIGGATSKYNELALERKRLLESSNEKNPIIVNLDMQLEGLKRSMRSSLRSMTNNLELQVNDLSSRQSQINSRIYSTPKNERALRDITRQQQTIESLYLYLLQKSEEAQITFASSSSKSKIVDNAYLVSQNPVFPNKALILLASLLLGLLLPFTVIYLQVLLDNKVKNKIGLEKLIENIPVLAEIPKISKKENILIRPGERNVLAESMRILRASLDYILKSKLKKVNRAAIIYVTSTVSGEGKTMLASNLAMTYAHTNKRILLIGADIRNPRIYQFYSGKNVDELGKSKRNKGNKGLTEYLTDKSLNCKDVISTMLAFEHTVDVIYSGKISPNPSELLMNGRFKELLDEVEDSYDYIIVDTAPLMVVADTLLISEFADQTLYVTRAGKTKLKVLEYPIKINKEGKLNGLSFIVNGVTDSNLGYGGKYGYGYNQTSKKWWNFS